MFFSLFSFRFFLFYGIQFDREKQVNGRKKIVYAYWIVGYEWIRVQNALLWLYLMTDWSAIYWFEISIAPAVQYDLNLYPTLYCKQTEKSNHPKKTTNNTHFEPDGRLALFKRSLIHTYWQTNTTQSFHNWWVTFHFDLFILVFKFNFAFILMPSVPWNNTLFCLRHKFSFLQLVNYDKLNKHHNILTRYQSNCLSFFSTYANWIGKINSETVI